MLLKIGGVEMPQVTEVTPDSFTITESNRNDNGDMTHEFITKKRRVSASFGILTHSERQTIYTALSQNNGLSLDVTFNNPDTGTPSTINCYAGDRSIKLLKLENGVPTHWSDFKINLIQN